MRRRLAAGTVIGLLGAAALGPGCGHEAPAPRRGAAAGWDVSTGDDFGRRFSPADEITPENVHGLTRAWEYRTGDRSDEATLGRNHSFEATPILVEENLVFCTPRSRVVALDAETGEPRWSFDPEVDLSLGHYNLNCRGVAQWLDRAAAPGPVCRRRIFVATADARLVALDAETGRPCPGFGSHGSVEFWRGIGMRERAEYGSSSPPVVVYDVVVVGSSVRENRRTDMPSGRIQAFHARTGARLWSFDPVPRDPSDPARATWQDGSADSTGGANVWSLGSADPARDLVFLPTTSPSPDWYGGARRGENRHADSVVALRASTGELVWAFQAVHHDLWDYDVGSQPVLLDWPGPDGPVPAVAQATKMGHVFFLHRETGAPLVPVEERPVPQTDVPGEWTAPTQAFPTWPPALVPQRLAPDDAWGLTRWDRAWCRDRIAALRSEGVFTPPSLGGSVIFPGTAGGSNWGSAAFDPERRLLFLNTSNIANWVQLVPHAEVDVEAERSRRGQGDYLGTGRMDGTPYAARFGVLVSPLGIPCHRPPWGQLAALDLAARELRWQVPLGTTRDLAPVPIGLPWGTPNMGGPLATASGLVFIAAALDDYLRAFDARTGAELWQGRLPAGGQATPMTYRVRDGGRQFVVIAAGGHSQLRNRRGDSLVAFALSN
jgi:quinoprotein glucose dehydrogenase